MTRWLGILAATALLLVSCAGSGETGTAPSSSTAQANPSKSSLVDPRKGGLEVGFGEWAIQLEAKEVRPGPITFVVRNGGTMTHGFEIESEEGDSSGHGSGDGLKIEANAFGPGDVVRVHANLAPGVYKIECFIANHDNLGMETLLIVRPNARLVRSSAAVPDEVVLDGFAFSPANLQVQTGTEVTWTNHDPTEHTVTADDGAFDSGVLDAGGSFSAQLDDAGQFTYRCQIHPTTMKGTVTVVR
jgi:plastocyanin